MLRREQSGTGGGPSQQKPLSDTFKRVLSIIGEEAACGDVEFRVPAFVSSIYRTHYVFN